MAPRPGLHRQTAVVANDRKVWVPYLAHRMTGTLMSMPAPMLPKTIELLEELERLVSTDDLNKFQHATSDRMASYRAVPETSLPSLRFHIAEADPALLDFAGKETPGFEVLDVLRAGFQHHWRRDLVRTFDEQIPFLGRLCGLSDAREVVVEHLSLPILRKGRVREIRGWLLFGEDPATGNEPTRLDLIAMFRRLEAPRPVRLPATLSRPDSETSKLQEILRALGERWGAGASRAGPTSPGS